MRTRSPERDKAFKLYEKSGKTMKNSEIASKLGVSASQIAKWKSQDKWDSESLPNDKVKGKKDTKSKGNKKGGQKGNKNAVGNCGGDGGPIGNNKNLKHGGYSQVFWNTITEEEKSIIEDMPQTEEVLLLEQVKAYTISEYRLMSAIKKLKSQKGEQTFYQIKIDEEKCGQEKIGVTKRQTTVENKSNAILRMEQQLTTVRRAKNQAIESLAKINLEKQKLELIRENNSEIEDTSETDEVIYGENSLQTETNNPV